MNGNTLKVIGLVIASLLAGGGGTTLWNSGGNVALVKQVDRLEDTVGELVKGQNRIFGYIKCKQEGGKCDK